MRTEKHLNFTKTIVPNSRVMEIVKESVYIRLEIIQVRNALSSLTDC